MALKVAQSHQNVHLSKKIQDLLAATDVTGSPQLPHTHLVLASPQDTPRIEQRGHARGNGNAFATPRRKGEQTTRCGSRTNHSVSEPMSRHAMREKRPIKVAKTHQDLATQSEKAIKGRRLCRNKQQLPSEF